MDRKTLAAMIEDLDVPPAESPHFLLHYALRNPISGRGPAWGGVRDPLIIRQYLHSLETAYETLCGLGWKAPKAGTAPNKIHGFVLESGALMLDRGTSFTDLDDQELPRLILPCDFGAKTFSNELLATAAVAVHELTHVFNHSYRPLDGIDTDIEDWEWFDEATAVYMEHRIVPGNPECLEFLQDWTDRPEISLDDPDACYERALFFSFLRKHFDDRLLAEVWRESRPEEGPIQALRRILQEKHGTEFCAADPSEGDFFSSGYAVDSYFVWDIAPEGYARFRERRVTETFSLGPGEQTQLEQPDGIDHLACRYYRFCPRDGTSGLHVELTSDASQPGAEHLRIHLLNVHPHLQRADHSASVRKEVANDQVRLTADLDGFDGSLVEHAVLVVVHCGDDEDGVEYQFVASAT
jgi:hypothetical protein